MNPVVVQTCLAGPLVVALGVDVVRRADRSPLHGSLLGLLVAILAWMAAQTLRFAGDAPPWPMVSFHLLFLSAHALPPLVLWTAALQARLPAFERGGRSFWLCAVPFAVLYLGFLTDPIHHLFYAAPDLGAFRESPREWAGPLFVAYQLWTYAVMLVAIGICAHVAWRAPSRGERSRAAWLAIAVLLPLVAQAGFMLGFIPLSFPLTPAVLGVSALVLVVAMRRYELFEAPPLLRYDVLEHLQDGFVLADGDGAVTDANAAAERILGVSREALVGEPLERVVRELQGPGDDPQAADRVARVAFDAAPVLVELDDARGRSVQVAARAVSRSGPHPAARFLVLRDRTDERRTERALRQRQKLESVGILAAGVAHEVNNPLAFVRANLVHVRDLEPKTDEERAEWVEVVDESLVGLDRIARIVEGLLRLSRRSSDETEPVSVNAAVHEALRFAALHDNRTVRVETDLAPDLPPVRASSDHLVQVFLNLFLNAKQALAGRERARLEVTTRFRDGGTVEVAVADNGPGVPESDRERIFAPFFTTRPPNEGTGLGLAIACDIVRDHGGTLELESPPEGGARFRVRLPAAGASRSPR